MCSRRPDDAPRRLRGHKPHLYWRDETATWKDAMAPTAASSTEDPDRQQWDGHGWEDTGSLERGAGPADETDWDQR